jgi:hypothetical protein
MAITKLSTMLRREVAIDGRPYIVTLDANGLKIVPKGRRKGRELAWRDLVSGEAALAVALNASLQATPRGWGGPVAAEEPMSERARKKKDHEDTGKNRRRMREAVQARQRPARRRSETDERDTVTYKRGSAGDRSRRGAT